ncbi:MAG: sigma-70 family RNA polymerase sigma factor [Thermoanaerobacteraceae bacterium]|nr:sigma-70 family RNA polymerase sigma factor [Thermoanaerobacteraceae bacterium]
MPKIALIDTSSKGDIQEELDMEKEFTYIFETYYKKVFNFVYYRVNHYYTAEDLTSQVFEKVMIKINTYDETKSPFEVWLFAIARNTVNDYFRNLQNHKFFSIDTIKNLISKKKTPEDIVEIAETNDELLKALSILDERERNLVALKFGAGLKNVEIAKVLGLTESNVGVILFRTMKKLKKELERMG